MLTNLISNKNFKILGKDFPKLIFVSGKGGVGKTTITSALGYKLAISGHKTLIISTDPAHSLSDSLDFHLEKGLITDFPSIKNLYLIELGFDSQLIKKNQKSIFGEIIFPISEEYIAFYEISKILSKILYIPEKFDYILFDMAPSGHSLRLISFPKKFMNHFKKITKTENKFAELIGDNKTLDKDERKKNINEKKKIISQLAFLVNILTNPDITQFILVLNLNYMSFIESNRLYNSLLKLNIKCDNLIVNKYEAENKQNTCKFCKKRYEEQNLIYNKVKTTFNKLNIHKIMLNSNEIKGLEYVKKIIPDSFN